jgi:hypothetical protein
MNPLSSKKIGENVSPTKGEVVLEDRVDSDHMEELSEMEASRVVGGMKLIGAGLATIGVSGADVGIGIVFGELIIGTSNNVKVE